MLKQTYQVCRFRKSKPRERGELLADAVDKLRAEREAESKRRRMTPEQKNEHEIRVTLVPFYRFTAGPLPW
jgi:hypothetical protein